ncbi:hypothetical protein ACD559_07510 [Streptococcus anginosus]|jgi:hypothetical protein|uniref:hypothetical protein n=1 Tax=Streptococcus anginosus TaxID=1328 RepID=UPI00124783CE|nr:hypothetical protein [Streptococcus anginosus]KAA9259773.1 hypothetical protein F6I23_07625 [Streptococcus anginosus]MDB8660499.1 hypothetical protein [Streptococcus anginosus]HEQ0291682.1 hypothetical protein [Streptococcus pyogenes]HES7273700.1 hypothetical protein [Streptococcus pyogenes]
MVVINLKNKVIPIDFGAFKLEFSKSDENIEKMERLSVELEKQAKIVSERQGESELKKAKELSIMAWDGVFGEGTFDKVYEVAGGSTLDTMSYYFEAMKGIKEEQVDDKTQALIKEYTQA